MTLMPHDSAGPSLQRLKVVLQYGKAACMRIGKLTHLQHPALAHAQACTATLEHCLKGSVASLHFSLLCCFSSPLAGRCNPRRFPPLLSSLCHQSHRQTTGANTLCYCNHLLDRFCHRTSPVFAGMQAALAAGAQRALRVAPRQGC